MNEPWGISGPVFAWSYAGLVLAPALLGLLVGRLLRQGWGAAPAESAPGIYQFAYLVAGADRVTETVVASLIEREQLRVSSTGTLRTTPLQPVDPLELEVTRLVASRFATTAYTLLPWLRASAEMAGLRTELGRRRWILPDARRRVIWRTVFFSYLAVFALGVVRLVNGASLGRPVGILFFLLCAVVLAAVLTYRRSRPGGKYETTKAGEAVRQMAKDDRSLAAEPARGVAKAGLDHYSDRKVAAALTKSYPRRGPGRAARSGARSAVVGAGFIGTSSCGGGGSSCGGGGSSCGGGGGGGGCGG
jgi:uncharacterized protein (TIGR04222 family)